VNADDEREEEAYFQWCIANRRPYFGPVMAAAQGNWRRHYQLQELVKRSAAAAREPLRMLEIGSWAGGSSLTITNALRTSSTLPHRVYCVDPWQVYDFNMVETGHYNMMRDALANGSALQLFMHNVGMAAAWDWIVMLRGKSKDVLPCLRPATFDLIFVDGDHRYSSASADLALASPLLKVGGILCGDDLEVQLDQADLDSCRANCEQDYYKDDPRAGRAYHPGVTLAVGEMFGRVAEQVGFWAMTKTDSGYAPTELPSLADAVPPRHFERHPEYRR
jgi:predicted O-methyltransferase YrrM